jgi:tetraacyldisaccharide 4'-kinase
MTLESFCISIIEGKKRAPLLRGALYVLSLGFQFISKIRNTLYDKRILGSYKSSLFTVSVGNLVAGGTGKTPFVEKLVRDLDAKPGLVAILTRGYRSKTLKNLVEVSAGYGPKVFAQEAGDEAYWLAKNTNAQVLSGKNRVASAQYAEKASAKILVLEDGLQHRKIQRDVEIILLNAVDLWGKGYFLPRGYLRDSPKRLAEADFIVVTHLEECHSDKKIVEEIRRFSKAPVIGLSATYTCRRVLENSKIGAFCGIAKPDSFFCALNNKRAVIVDSLISEDHVLPSLKELALFADGCKKRGAEFLVCTEKDLVKLPKDLELSLPIETLKMEFDCVLNQNSWKEMVEMVKSCVYLRTSGERKYE